MNRKGPEILANNVFDALLKEQRFTLSEMMYFCVALLRRIVQWSRASGNYNHSRKILAAYAFTFIKDFLVAEDEIKEANKVALDTIAFANQILDLALHRVRR